MQKLAKDLIDFNFNNQSGLEFGYDTVHLFVSPLFVEPIKQLMQKKIKSISCGSGKERYILPGITCEYDSLNDENKEIVKTLLISKTEFRIGCPIFDDTTSEEFTNNLIKTINKLVENK